MKKDIALGKIVLIILFCWIIVGVIIVSCVEAESAKRYAKGVFECPNCGSTETHGFHTFNYNDHIFSNNHRIIGTGSFEYELDNADYSIFSCDYCGEDWRVYRAEWEAKGY